MSRPYRAPGEASAAEHRLTCPFCGHGFDAALPRCPECDVAIERARCAACGALVTIGARACERCGASLPVLATDDPVGGPCPRCGAPLAAVSAEADLGVADTLCECAACRGVFIGHAALVEAARRWRRGEAIPTALLDAAEPSEDVVRYLACPACGRRMNRKRFGRVVVDVCARHGTWMDRGEPSRVLDRVEIGREALARRASAEEVAADVRMRVEALRETRAAEERGSLLAELLRALFGVPPA